MNLCSVELPQSKLECRLLGLSQDLDSDDEGEAGVEDEDPTGKIQLTDYENEFIFLKSTMLQSEYSSLTCIHLAVPTLK